MSIRDTILNVKDLKEETVTVPEWDGVTVIVRGMTGAERYAMADAVTKGKGAIDLAKATVGTLLQCVLDPDNRKPVFDPADRDALLAKSGAVLDRLLDVMRRLSGIGDAGLAEAEKN